MKWTQGEEAWNKEQEQDSHKEGDEGSKKGRDDEEGMTMRSEKRR